MLTVVTAATTLPVTVAQARTHCRAPESGDDDELIERALRSAIEYVEQHTEHILQPTTLMLRLACWPCWSGGYRRGHEIDLPKKPVRDVVAVEYLDTSDNLQTVASGNWSWRQTADGGVVRFVNTYSFPTLTANNATPLWVTFDAGYDDPTSSGSGDDPNLALPQRVVSAVLLKTELLYDRGSHTEAAVKQIEAALASLLDQIRVYR